MSTALKQDEARKWANEYEHENPGTYKQLAMPLESYGISEGFAKSTITLCLAIGYRAAQAKGE